MSPHESSKPEEAAENASDKTSSKHELSNSLNKLNVEEIKRKDTLNDKILNATEGSHSLKRTVKKKSKGLPKYKTNPVKSSQNKEKKIKKSKNKDLLTYANKTDRPIKVYPKTVLTTIEKKDSSILSHSMSLESLEDLRKTLKETISPASRTIDKVQNFINDKKDLMTSTSLENDSQREKMANNSEKLSLKPYGLASCSKIPVHEFRTYQAKSNKKTNEILLDPLQDKYRIKDKECKISKLCCNDDNQREKMADNSEKQPLKPYGLASGSKIPVNEFRRYQTKINEKTNEILLEALQENYRIKDKECKISIFCCNDVEGAYEIICRRKRSVATVTVQVFRFRPHQ
ncbi:hypothetical protein AVEN_28150-1 [Araneus ventricosus]|uniref:Uncharacterized protein n=1 Tax=Araneus ventricosus TaxID=182803 RepID=A0A4Y2H6B8_ARAVE|nr:hypothetical protein AVEN_28150-1 [Araneus ventricosus]